MLCSSEPCPVCISCHGLLNNPHHPPPLISKAPCFSTVYRNGMLIEVMEQGAKVRFVIPGKKFLSDNELDCNGLWVNSWMMAGGSSSFPVLRQCQYTYTIQWIVLFACSYLITWGGFLTSFKSWVCRTHEMSEMGQDAIVRFLQSENTSRLAVLPTTVTELRWILWWGAWP